MSPSVFLRTLAALVLITSLGASARDLVGSWFDSTHGDFITFQSNGRFVSVGPETDGGCNPATDSILGAGTWSVSGAVITGRQDFDVSPCITVSPYTTTTTFAVSESHLTLTKQGNLVNGSFSTPAEVLTYVPAQTLPDWALPPPAPIQAVYTLGGGRIAAAQAVLTATGRFSRATVSVALDVGAALAAVPLPDGQSTCDVWAFAYFPNAGGTPATPLIFIKQKPPAGWALLQLPIPAYAERMGATPTTRTVVVDFVGELDIRSLLGLEFYVGCGASPAEMLSSGRYRGVYRLP